MRSRDGEPKLQRMPSCDGNLANQLPYGLLGLWYGAKKQSSYKIRGVAGICDLR
jgi:hypothetical protein